MTAAIRHIWGPYGETLIRERQQSQTIDVEVRWHFHGVRSDGTMSSWMLTFDISERKWRASGRAMPNKPCQPDRVNAMLPRDLADMPVLTGKVVDLLKGRLASEHIATVTRLAIAAAR